MNEPPVLRQTLKHSWRFDCRQRTRELDALEQLLVLAVPELLGVRDHARHVEQHAIRAAAAGLLHRRSQERAL